MQPARPPLRAPGGFSPLPSGNSAEAEARRPGRLESFASDDSAALSAIRSRKHSVTQPGSATPIYASFTAHNESTASSQQNFSRPTLSTAASAARSAAGTHSPSDVPRGACSPLANFGTVSVSTPAGSSTFSGRINHTRKHSTNAGSFEPTLPSTTTSNLPQIALAQATSSIGPGQRGMLPSQIAAQAAVMQHQQSRQRSQTVPVPGADHDAQQGPGAKRGSGQLKPPTLSLTVAGTPTESAHMYPSYSNGRLGSHSSAATMAANMVLSRSTASSPAISTQPMLPPLPSLPEKPVKAEKSKAKLFSRPGKIGTKSEAKEKPPPSPHKIGQALSNLQRGNFSTTSLDSAAQSFYSLANSSSATIRPVETPTETRESKEKEKKHHFLSRQKHKLKDDFHLPLSSASSNSRPTDPNAPSSLYNFHLPPSPGANSSGFKSGLDLRHGGRALREKKKDDKIEEATSSHVHEWPGPTSVTSSTGLLGSSIYNEPFDSSKYGLHNMTYDDAWPFLKAKMLVIFEGEDLRLPVEDFNKIVTMYIQYCMARRSPSTIIEDLRELLATGFASLDQALKKIPDDRLIPAVVDQWLFSFTSILPYIQAVFLPLDLEFSGHGPLMTADQARDFWAGLVATACPADNNVAYGGHHLSQSSSLLGVRRLVLLSFRDTVILARYETLKSMFSRLSLEFLPQSCASLALSPPLPPPTGFHNQGQPPCQQALSASPSDSQAFSSLANAGRHGSFSIGPRPGTAISLDPSNASYNSSSTTLLGGDSSSASGNRSRAISNVSFGSDTAANPASMTRPYTPSSLQALGGSGSHFATTSRDMQNVEAVSRQVTDMVGRMLQCISVLASVGVGTADEGNRRIEELNNLLKLNWLGRGRTGRNRRGIVGGRARRAGVVGAASEAVRRESTE